MNQPRNQDRDDAGIAVLIVEDAPASLTAHLPHPTPHRPAAAPTRRGRWLSRLAWLGVIVLVFAALTVLFLLGELPRRHQAVALAAAVEQNAHRLIQVRVVTPKPAPAATTLNLPGNIEAARSTGIFAQAGGLVSERSVEIGDHVTAGQVLARIDTSEVARELARAEATLTLANASVELATVQFNRARTDYERTVPLGPALVGQQVLDHLLADRDTSAANLDVAKGQVAVDAAEVARLRLLVGYGEVTAPFAGIITARNLPVRVSMSWFYLNCDLIHVSKATGIARLLARLRLDPRRLAGIGDTAGDLAIADSVGWFACPANADDTIRARANYRSPFAETAGVVDILEHLRTKAG